MRNQHADSRSPSFDSSRTRFNRDIAPSRKTQERSTHESTTCKDGGPHRSENVLECKERDDRQSDHCSSGMRQEYPSQQNGRRQEDKSKIARFAFFPPIDPKQWQDRKKELRQIVRIVQEPEPTDSRKPCVVFHTLNVNHRIGGVARNVRNTTCNHQVQADA